MTISLELILDGSAKEKVKSVVLRQGDTDVAQWAPNGQDNAKSPEDSVSVKPGQTDVLVIYDDDNKDENDIDANVDGYVFVMANGAGSTDIIFTPPID
ncbi:hypothetical protein [Sneathiella sp.]|uniref:hypothetical protein n=1 Tax=Sneathiella sp. TaxID=1964365 RepID=UPI0025FD1AFE|nr:hypothetical protein [Sneathiella sp.]